MQRTRGGGNCCFISYVRRGISKNKQKNNQRAAKSPKTSSAEVIVSLLGLGSTAREITLSPSVMAA